MKSSHSHLAIGKHRGIEPLEHRRNEKLGGGVKHVHLRLRSIKHAVERVAVVMGISAHAHIEMSATHVTNALQGSSCEACVRDQEEAKKIWRFQKKNTPNTHMLSVILLVYRFSLLRPLCK